MTNSLSITVVGAGAIGSAVAFSLARAGFAPKLVARGETLAAIRRDGLQVEKWEGGGVVRLEVTDTPVELGAQDLVIGRMKAQDWPAGLAALTPLIGPQTALLPPINGVPWWYFDGQAGPLRGERIAAVDPEGALLGALPARSVIGSVVYMGVARLAPGVVRWTSGNKFVLGEADGARRERTEQVAAVLRASGFDVTVTDDIRGGVWTKLIGNARAAIEAFWRQAAQQMGDAKLTTLDGLPLGRNAAREIGTVSLKTKSQPPQEVVGKYAVVWRKIGGQWKLATDIWNTNK